MPSARDRGYHYRENERTAKHKAGKSGKIKSAENNLHFLFLFSAYIFIWYISAMGIRIFVWTFPSISRLAMVFVFFKLVVFPFFVDHHDSLLTKHSLLV